MSQQASGNILYIAGNKYLNTREGTEILKVGITDDIERRMKELSQPTGVPGWFVVRHAVRFPTRERAWRVEQTLLKATFEDYRLSDGGGKTDDSEFLVISLPKLIATLSSYNDAEEVSLLDNPLAEEDEDDDDLPVPPGKRRQIGVNEIGIQNGAQLIIVGTARQGFKETKVPVVRAEHKSRVEWDGQYLTLSDAAARIRNAKGGISGFLYFQYEDPQHGREDLYSRRLRWEREGLL